MASKFYAVKVGRTPGVYTTWNDAKNEVNGYSGAVYKSFPTLTQAQQFIDPNYSPAVPISQPPVSRLHSIMVYTDGSSSNNIGGYGIVQVNDNQLIKSYSGRCPGEKVTNNMAELYAVWQALKIYQNSDVTIYTDSKYVIGCLTEWVYKWLSNGWQTFNGQSVANRQLIEEILILQKDRLVTYNHVKAHQGNQFNELADQLANQGRQLDS